MNNEERKEQMKMLVDVRLWACMTNEDGNVAVATAGKRVKNTQLDVLAEAVGWEAKVVRMLQQGLVVRLNTRRVKSIMLGLGDPMPQELASIYSADSR